MDLLRRLAGLSLLAASQLLGISPTALKRACRKVGVRHWTEIAGHQVPQPPPPPSYAIPVPFLASRRDEAKGRNQPTPPPPAVEVEAVRLPTIPDIAAGVGWGFAPAATTAAGGLDLDHEEPADPSAPPSAFDRSAGSPSPLSPSPPHAGPSHSAQPTHCACFEGGAAQPETAPASPRGWVVPALSESVRRLGFGEGLWLEVPELDLPELV
jgi:hypothetical protein